MMCSVLFDVLVEFFVFLGFVVCVVVGVLNVFGRFGVIVVILLCGNGIGDGRLFGVIVWDRFVRMMCCVGFVGGNGGVRCWCGVVVVVVGLLVGNGMNDGVIVVCIVGVVFWGDFGGNECVGDVVVVWVVGVGMWIVVLNELVSWLFGSGDDDDVNVIEVVLNSVIVNNIWFG